MTFIKSTPGATCRSADALGASWHYCGNNNSAREAVMNGIVVAYTDCTGWYIADL